MYTKKAHIHFVGIGGIGMSGIATILRYQGYTISGCDKDLSQKSIHDLKLLGCTIVNGNNTTGCHDTSIDILVYSSAIKPDNPEILAAQQRGIPTIPRALMLAELMRTKYSVAIAGSHGKTTTTSLISHILIESQKDPTVVIGGILKSISSNARFGSGDFLVAEADESDRSFLHLYATLAVVTNIDLEHLETYKNLQDVKDTFSKFLTNIPFYGKAFVCIDDINIQSILPIPHIKTVKYGFCKTADLYASDIELKSDKSYCTIWQQKHKKPLGTVELAMPGQHNILNALAAIAVSRELGVSFETIQNALQNFKGVERRFSYRGTFKGARVYDDYGHHPTEIHHTLLVAKQYTDKKVTVIFQPHRYSRTQKLWNEFIKSFVQSDIDHLIITDVYPASEAPITHITGKNLAAAIAQQNPRFTVSYAPCDVNFHQLRTQIENSLGHNDLLLLLGAGNVYKMAETLIS